MSISYSIAYSSLLTVKEIGQKIESLGFQFDQKHGGRHPIVPTMTYFSDGLIIDLIEEDSLGKEIYSDELGMNINQKMIIAVPDDISYTDENTQKIIKLLVQICSECEEIVFLFNGEKVLLLKNKTKLELDSVSPFWSEQNQIRISEGCGEYERNKLPVI
jgi:hypothetical protein